MAEIEVSDCCGAGLDVAGHTTRYYTCRECGQPCDAAWGLVTDCPAANPTLETS